LGRARVLPAWVGLPTFDAPQEPRTSAFPYSVENRSPARGQMDQGLPPLLKGDVRARIYDPRRYNHPSAPPSHYGGVLDRPWPRMPTRAKKLTEGGGAHRVDAVDGPGGVRPMGNGCTRAGIGGESICSANISN
jgi:hypothetical protein